MRDSVKQGDVQVELLLPTGRTFMASGELLSVAGDGHRQQIVGHRDGREHEGD